MTEDTAATLELVTRLSDANSKLREALTGARGMLAKVADARPSLTSCADAVRLIDYVLADTQVRQ